MKNTLVYNQYTVDLWLKVLEVSLIHGCFSRFLNCTNCSKSHKASHMFKILYQDISKSIFWILSQQIKRTSKKAIWQNFHITKAYEVLSVFLQKKKPEVYR